MNTEYPYAPYGAQLRERTIHALLASPLANCMSPTDIFQLAQSIQVYVEDGTPPVTPAEWDARRFGAVTRRICEKGLSNKALEHLSKEQAETLSQDLKNILEKTSALQTSGEKNASDSSPPITSTDLPAGALEFVTVEINDRIKSNTDRILFVLLKKMDNCNLTFGDARRYVRNGNVSICGKQTEKVVTDENCRVLSGTVKFRRGNTVFVAKIGEGEFGAASFLLSNAAWPETLP